MAARLTAAAAAAVCCCGAAAGLPAAGGRNDNEQRRPRRPAQPAQPDATPAPYLGLVPPTNAARGRNDNEFRQPRRPAQPQPAATPAPYLGLVPPTNRLRARNDGEGRQPRHPAVVPPPPPAATPAPYLGLVPPTNSLRVRNDGEGRRARHPQQPPPAPVPVPAPPPATPEPPPPPPAPTPQPVVGFVPPPNAMHLAMNGRMLPDAHAGAHWAQPHPQLAQVQQHAAHPQAAVAAGHRPLPVGAPAAAHPQLHPQPHPAAAAAPHRAAKPDPLAHCRTAAAALNTTEWVATRKATPTLSWRAARPEDMVARRVGHLIAQDNNLKWWPVVLRQRNPDGSWQADVVDGTGAQWDSVWMQYCRAREVAYPAAPFVTERHSACAGFDATCTPLLPDAALRRASALCVSSLHPQVWEELSQPQAAAIHPAALHAGITPAQCERIGEGAARGLSCAAGAEWVTAPGCAQALRKEALGSLPAKCVTAVPPAAFEQYAMEQLIELVKGGNGVAMTNEQMGHLTGDACEVVGHEMPTLADLGTDGVRLCAAVRTSCWLSLRSVEVEKVPSGCLARLPPAALRSAATGEKGRDGKEWCAHGAAMLAGMAPAQRAAVPPGACDSCLNDAGVGGYFPQCGGPVAARPTVRTLAKAANAGAPSVLMGIGTAGWAVVAIAAGAGFAAGVSARRAAGHKGYASLR